MRYNPERVAQAFAKLFQTYPSFQADAAEDTMRVYFEAVELYETQDIEAAVANFLSGTAPGVNAAFAPPAPSVAAEARRCMNVRLESERRRSAPRGSLPAPKVERTDDSRARVAAALNAALGQLETAKPEEDAEAQRKRQAHNSKLFARFDPPQDEAAMAKRLGFTVADSDVDGDMGGQAA